MSDRRSFLRGLVTLPLIGGGVALIGNPTAAAVPVTTELLECYRDWLAVEYGETLIELDARCRSRHAAYEAEFRRHWCRDNRTLNPDPDSGRFLAAPNLSPLTRAAVILSAAGVPLTHLGQRASL